MEEFAWVLDISREVEVIRGDESEMRSVPAARTFQENGARIEDGGEPR